ncbi:MAG TPA: carboxypeptidase-like regulatory domain-containing protein, partial [Pyrinomonadaceae bacterium]|nr:carboxypeptidase-like regulatory domain-containing protein [Pyrinomonadaceae bacterium]
MKSNRRVLLLIVLSLLLAAPVLAQTHRASLRGTVYDPNGAVIQGAAVTLTNVATNEARTTTSNDKGEYTIASLPAGVYQVEVEKSPFVKFSGRVELLVNQTGYENVTLQVPGTTGNVVDVPFTTELKKDTPSLGAVIDNRQVTGLPLDGRNFYELSLLVPGAVPPAQGSAGSVRGDFSFSVNGAREDANNFLLDGVYNIDPKLNTFGVRPSVDAIREFEMLTSTYDASFGRNPGAQINVILNSGSNDFHGSLFEFHRNAALDARNFFAPASEPKPKYLRNQFGGSIGGPIVRNRTFFFADYEGTRSREGITRITNVPTAEERAGNFSNSLFGIPTNPFTGQPFDGGVIPSFFINPVGRGIAALYPLPNRDVPFQNFVSSPTQREDNDSFDVRVDHRLTDSADLTFRYSFG